MTRAANGGGGRRTADGGGRRGRRRTADVMSGPELSLEQQQRPSDVVAEHAWAALAGLM
jgi:hypothetical protein